MRNSFVNSKLPVKYLLILSISLMFISSSFARNQAPSLVEAAEQGDVAAVQQALDQGANIEQRDKRQRTPLMAATHANQIEVARLLIDKGADVNARDSIEDSPYLYAGARGLQEILVMTLNHGADLKSLNRYGGTALIPAAERGHVETVQTLIDAGVEVDYVNRLGWTALIEAIVLGDGSDKYGQIVTRLIQGGADVNKADGKGNSPLTLAKQKGQRNMIEILKSAGAK
ncbi:ankyrin repeat domain-containing protein [uncultured Cedecea sp.]|uniref:ankyrin repeat domain-containing protein n=1 Tax=uncultured Cedecea sp. TaxID=988762 RepID=UPI00260D9400|nr:ankyrin repeat domain-containing protein [uncultured Cedecea sp.]